MDDVSSSLRKAEDVHVLVAEANPGLEAEIDQDPNLDPGKLHLWMKIFLVETFFEIQNFHNYDKYRVFPLNDNELSDQDLLVVHDHPLHEDHAPGPSPVTEEGPDPGKLLFLSMKLRLELDSITF